MAALPYTARWVGLDGAPPPNENKWHLWWEDNDQTLCGLYIEEEGPITAMRLPSEMTTADRGNECGFCQILFRRVVYWRVENGESVEDLRG